MKRFFTQKEFTIVNMIAGPTEKDVYFAYVIIDTHYFQDP